jgi:hypothetical protein
MGQCKGKMALPSLPIIDLKSDQKDLFIVEKQSTVEDSRRLVFEDTIRYKEFKLVCIAMTYLKMYIENTI